jgi:formylglycine-generating enzyme required for sulfatase activity
MKILPPPALCNSPTFGAPARAGKVHRASALQRVVRAACLSLACLVSSNCGDNQEIKARGKSPGELMNLKIGTEMVAFSWVPRGKFLMGSPESETARESDEQQVEVEIEKGFWLARTECTQKLWVSVMGTNPAEFKKDSSNPVETVSWDDCQQFLAAIQKHSPNPAWRFDLPTEAQWEYACRADSPYPFPDRLENISWFLNNARGTTKPVGTKTPNRLGLHDMHGNVAEWCSSLYVRRDAGAPSDEALAAEDGKFRVIRGGSWDSAWACRAAARNSDSPSLRINRVGFRIALVPVE